MKSRNHIFTLVALALGIGAPIAQAAIVFNDTFTDPGTAGWYASRASSTLTNTSNTLVFATTSNSNDHRITGKSFTGQTLSNVGDTIRLTFDINFNGTISLFRVGLFQVGESITADDWNNSPANVGTVSLWGNAYSGYYSFFRDNATTNETRRDAATAAEYSTGGNAPTLQTDANISSGSTPTSYDIVTNGSQTYQVLFEITRTATGVDTLTTLSSGLTTHLSMAGTHMSGSPYLSYDSVFIQSTSGTSNTTATLDNITLEIIPEPHTALLGGLGLLALWRRRRA